MLKRFIAMITLCAVPCLSASTGSSQVFELEDQLVLKAALESRCQSTGTYAVLSSTAAGPRADDDMGADESGAFQDLKLRNGSTAALPAALSCAGVRLHDRGAIDRLFGLASASEEGVSLDERWKKFYASFPGAHGWMTLSLPGYSSDRDIALVYVAHYCGSLCGGGAYVYLRRVEGQWKVIISIPTWVS